MEHAHGDHASSDEARATRGTRPLRLGRATRITPATRPMRLEPVLMSASTVIVAPNAQLLRRVRV